MTDQTSSYPFDYASRGLCAILQDKPVVSLSSWIAYGAAAAARSGRQFAVLTPSNATITFPLAVLLGNSSCSWIATSPTNSLYDGFTGRALQWGTDGVVPRGDEVEEHFLLAEPRPSGYVHVRAEIVHQASFAATVGTFTEAVVEAVTGASPIGWGLHEPVSETWDAAAVSSFSFDRSPRESRFVVIGAPRVGSSLPISTTGVLTVERTATAVVETIELLVHSDDPLGQAELEAFAEAMHRARARTALVGHGVGYTALTRPARFTGATVPACAVFGAEALTGIGAKDAATRAERTGGGVHLLGTAPAQSLTVLYPAEEANGVPHPLEAHAALTVDLAGLAP